MKKITFFIALSCLIQYCAIQSAALLKDQKEAFESSNNSNDNVLRISKQLIKWSQQHIPKRYLNAFQTWILKRTDSALLPLAILNAEKCSRSNCSDDEETQGIAQDMDIELLFIQDFERSCQSQDTHEPFPLTCLTPQELGLADEKEYQEFMNIALGFLQPLLKVTYLADAPTIVNVFRTIGNGL